MTLDLIPLALASALAALLAAATRVQGLREPTPAHGLTEAQLDDLVLTLAAWGTFAAVLGLAVAQLPRPLALVGLLPALLGSTAVLRRFLDRLQGRTLVELKIVAALGIAACGAALWLAA